VPATEEPPRGRRAVLVATIVLAVTASQFAGLVALTAPASAATITVDAGGGADYDNLQWAIDNATAGDVIEVADGTYALPSGASARGYVVDEDVTIRGDVGSGAGAGASAPRVRGRTHGFVLTQNASGATIEGFELDPKDEDGGIGFDLPAGETLADVTIQNNTFAGLDSSDEEGVDGTNIDGNLSNLDVVNNRFVGSGSSADVGIELLDDDDRSSSATGTTYENLTVSDNEFEGLAAAVEIVHSTPDGSVTNVVFTGNDVRDGGGTADVGLELYVNGYGDGATVSGVTIADNGIDTESYPVYFHTLGDAVTVEDVLVENNTLSTATTRTRITVAQVGSSLSRLGVYDNDISSNSGSDPAIGVATSSGADMDSVAICNNTVTAVDDGITVNYGNGNGTDVDVVNNTVDATGGSGNGIHLTAGDRSENVTVAGNTVGATETVGANGIWLDFHADGGTARDVRVLSNVIRGDNEHGIEVSVNQEDGLVDGLNVSHNDVSIENGSDAQGMRIHLTAPPSGTPMIARDVALFHNNVSSRAEGLELDVTSLNTSAPIEVSRNRFDVATADESAIYVSDDGSSTTRTVAFRNNDVDGIPGYAVHVDTFASLSTSVEVTDNDLRNNVAGLYVDAQADGGSVTASGNNIAGNAIGVNNTGSGVVAATDNWWGASDGPSGGYEDPNDVGVIADGSGDAVSNFTGLSKANVDFYPNATTAFSLDLYDPNAPAPAVSCPTVTQGAATGGSAPTPTPSAARRAGPPTGSRARATSTTRSTARGGR